MPNTDVLSWDSDDQQDYADRERFRITDDAQATWAMRKLAAAREALNGVANVAEAEIARVQAWAEQRSRQALQDAQYFEGILCEYARAQRAEGRKSVSTPYGTVKSRAGSPRWTIDAEAFLAWARTAHPDLIRVKEEPALAAVKDALQVADGGAVDPATGEVVPGVAIAEAEVTYSVEVAL